MDSGLWFGDGEDWPLDDDDLVSVLLHTPDPPPVKASLCFCDDCRRKFLARYPLGNDGTGE